MEGTGEKKERIRKIAFDYFVEIGYEATTVRMICRKAAIEPPTLYYFFESKRGIFLDVLSTLVEEYKSAAAPLLSESTGQPEEILKEYYKFCIRYVKENRTKALFYYRCNLFKPMELKEDIERYIQNSFREQVELLKKYLRMHLDVKNIQYPMEESFQRYINYINQWAFSVVFPGWMPTDEEIERLWEIFCSTFMSV